MVNGIWNKSRHWIDGGGGTCTLQAFMAYLFEKYNVTVFLLTQYQAKSYNSGLT